MTLDEVIAESARLGPIAYLATADGAGAPEVTPITPGWKDRLLYVAVASTSRRVANLRANPQVAVHWAVSSRTDHDGLEIRGAAVLLETPEAKAPLWQGVLPYELSKYFTSPADPALVFIAVEPRSALLMLRMDTAGRRRWRASTTPIVK